MVLPGGWPFEPQRHKSGVGLPGILLLLGDVVLGGGFPLFGRYNVTSKRRTGSFTAKAETIPKHQGETAGIDSLGWPV